MVSLLKLAEITEEGVKFQSPHDSSEMMLTPEHSIHIQNKIGKSSNKVKVLSSWINITLGLPLKWFVYTFFWPSVGKLIFFNVGGEFYYLGFPMEKSGYWNGENGGCTGSRAVGCQKDTPIVRITPSSVYCLQIVHISNIGILLGFWSFE